METRTPIRMYRHQQWRVASRHLVTHDEWYGHDFRAGFWGSPAWARRQALWWMRQLEAKCPGYVYWLEPGAVVVIPVYG